MLLRRQGEVDQPPSDGYVRQVKNERNKKMDKMRIGKAARK
jgi:hypothetical protein